ncbi:MAG: ATP-binding protein, partial [Candidatus Cloacimonetes bacterium]|nr:ATP-binding protein [Candidatus Cloacimonadota bacterium]
MIPRDMLSNLRKAAAGFPVVTITGPRQSGKTTLARIAFPDYNYLDLEHIPLRRIMLEDPLSVLSDPMGFYIIDEFQYVPELLSYVKVMVDKSGLEAQFVLTGSNQYALMQGLTQSLAGRTALFELLPFSFEEADSAQLPLDDVITQGFYPRLIDKKIDTELYYNAYLSTYLQRDVRLLSNVQNLDTFSKFVALCAGRSGSILNKEALANDTGVAAKTVDNWLSVLHTSYIAFTMQP